MKSSERAQRKPRWSKTQYANLVRYNPSGKYFARIRVQGKLIRQSLKTDRISVAKLRLADLEKEERRKVESRAAAVSGKMTFSEAVGIFKERLKADVRQAWPDTARAWVGVSAPRPLAGLGRLRDRLPARARTGARRRAV